MHLFVVFLITNHQCLVMNHLQLSGPESDGQDANSCNTVFPVPTTHSYQMLSQTKPPAQLTLHGYQLMHRFRKGLTRSPPTPTHIASIYIIMTHTNCAFMGFNMTFLS